MSRLEALRAEKPGILGRIVNFVTRRKLGHVPEPVRVLHKNTAILLGVGAFETALERARLVPHRLKALAEIRVALLVGCPF